MRLLPMGYRAVLVTDLDTEPAAWSRGVRAAALPGVVDVVPAAETVLVVFDDEQAMASVGTVLADVPATTDEHAGAGIVDIPTRYDGADLAAVADATGLDVDGVIELHRRAVYTVAFCGFAPGFGYLRGLDARLHLPRRATPRTSVPAGAVAIASEYTAVYPRSSPGGWHLLGSTEVRLFDTTRPQPALLAPGTRVRFVPR